ncbi:hypothetical protein [Ureaplasma canigenitalium]|uniref:hypothetical protein n=1 Tax=Ureaplasma canigenitalium TaxID=42092 RepID=UPI0004E22E56|nr:hypothetical protein [Ureaplasma canigenitalium]
MSIVKVDINWDLKLSEIIKQYDTEKNLHNYFEDNHIFSLNEIKKILNDKLKMDDDSENVNSWNVKKMIAINEAFSHRFQLGYYDEELLKYVPADPIEVLNVLKQNSQLREVIFASFNQHPEGIVDQYLDLEYLDDLYMIDKLKDFHWENFYCNLSTLVNIPLEHKKHQEKYPIFFNSESNLRLFSSYFNLHLDQKNEVPFLYLKNSIISLMSKREIRTYLEDFFKTSDGKTFLEKIKEDENAFHFLRNTIGICNI